MFENVILEALLNFFQTLAAQIKSLLEFYFLPSLFCIILLGQDTKFKASSLFHKYKSRLCRDTEYSKHNSCMLHTIGVKTISQHILEAVFILQECWLIGRHLYQRLHCCNSYSQCITLLCCAGWEHCEKGARNTEVEESEQKKQPWRKPLEQIKTRQRF